MDSQSPEDMFECLVQHGCPDISASIDRGQYSSSPVANGGFGEVWRVQISTGLVLAVKTLRFRTLLEGDDKAAKVCTHSSPELQNCAICKIIDRSRFSVMAHTIAQVDRAHSVPIVLHPQGESPCLPSMLHSFLHLLSL